MMPLDELIQKRKPAKESTKTAKVTIKRTASVPVSRATRMRNSALASATKRQNAVNKRRTGLVVAPTKRTATSIAIKRRQGVAGKTPSKLVTKKQVSAFRSARAAQSTVLRSKQRMKQRGQASQSTLNVSNIQRHFRTHPKKFDLPQGTNLRITINLDKVKPVIGAGKK